MAGRSKNAGRRLLTLKGNRWWFRREIPQDIREDMGKGRFWLVNLGTGDLGAARKMRDEMERETTDAFAAIRAGEVIGGATLSAREQGVLHRGVIAAVEDQRQEEPDGPLGLFDVAVASAEATADTFHKPAEREAFLSALHGYEPVDAHLGAYLGLAKITPKTRKERAGLIGRMAAWAAGQTPRALTLDRIDRRQAGRYVSEVIDQMHPATQTKHLTALRGYWKYLASRGLIDLPPGEPRGAGWPWSDQQLENRGKRVERGSREADEREFTEQEVRALLYSPDPDGMRPGHTPQAGRKASKPRSTCSSPMPWQAIAGFRDARPRGPQLTVPATFRSSVCCRNAESILIPTSLPAIQKERATSSPATSCCWTGRRGRTGTVSARQC